MSMPFDQILCVDYETYWDSASGYTLSKITNEEYVRSDEFISHGACVHVYGSDDPVVWYDTPQLIEFYKTVDWSRTAVLAHNAQFDVSVMTWRHGANPVFIFDTLSMARATRGVEVGNSLAKLAKAFELPDKGTALHNTNGVKELTPKMREELIDYCKHDVFLCEEIFKRLLVGYPAKELRLIDMTLRMYTGAMLVLDENMLTQALLEEKTNREDLLTKLGATDKDLASNEKFAKMLEAVGVTPPTKKKKPTAKTPNPTGVNYAFAKTDAMFQAMLNSDNQDVADLCQARLSVKSTTERTRAQRFLDIAGRGTLPVPLSYYGAKSGRWTAAKGSAINMQNLKRGSFLRKAIMAPKGHQLVVGDLSQIEPRVLAWLADYHEMLDIFRAGGDPYAAFGASMFGIPDLNKDDHPDLRQSAKSALLGCGYGLGWASFAPQLMVGFLGAPPVRYDKKFAKSLGVDSQMVDKFLSWEKNIETMQEIPRLCTDEELLVHCLATKRIVDIYRQTAHPVVGFWNICGALIERSLYGGVEYTHKCITFRKGEVELPNGMKLLYPDLRPVLDEEGRTQWVYGEDATKLYSGKLVNNITQGTARIVMTDGMLRTQKKYFIAGTVHDEQLAVVPDEEVEFAKTWVLAQMTMEPPYMPGIPLAADGGAHRRYGLAKN